MMKIEYKVNQMLHTEGNFKYENLPTHGKVAIFNLPHKKALAKLGAIHVNSVYVVPGRFIVKVVI